MRNDERCACACWAAIDHRPRTVSSALLAFSVSIAGQLPITWAPRGGLGGGATPHALVAGFVDFDLFAVEVDPVEVPSLEGHAMSSA